MLLGFAITRHCNLRCPHCIRDDVESVRELGPALIGRVLDDALALWGDVTVSLTGGEPLIHRRFDAVIETIASRGVPYRFVSNGWHLKRIVPLLRRWPAQSVRLSLSGGDAAVHDAERGRDSFRRVLLAVGLLTYLRIPAYLSMVIDRRDRHQIGTAVELAESLGCAGIHFILPQPVTGSIERDTDLDPEEWWAVAREVRALAREPGRRTGIRLDYGAPFDGDELPCDTFTHRRVYVDASGRLSTCCQLSEYGFNENDVVANLHEVSLRDAWPRYVERLAAQQAASARPDHGGDAFDAFPCIRCARTTGKLDWLRRYPESRWAAGAPARKVPALVRLTAR
ncbi:MAG TPA: radical SAM protein [Longimicrobiales bacterium]